MFINRRMPDGSGKIIFPATFKKTWDEKPWQLRPLTYEKYERTPARELLVHKFPHWLQTFAGVYIGADPEIFVVDGAGMVIPAWTFLPKKNPRSKDFYDLYWDGWQAEFQTPARACLAFFADEVRAQLKKLWIALPKGAKLSIANVVPVETDGVPDEYVALGCAPSLNAYDEVSHATFSGQEVPVRFAGGHIHFGFDTAHYNPAGVKAAVKMMDRIAGLSAVCLARELDRPERRRIYGRAGEYRRPKHGLEYRVLSNFWLCAPEIMHLTCELTRLGFTAGFLRFGELFIARDAEVQDAINSTDPTLALKILTRNKALVKALFKQCPLRAWYPEKQFRLYWRALEGGVGAVISDPADIVNNWRLGEMWHEHSNRDQNTWHKLAE